MKDRSVLGSGAVSWLWWWLPHMEHSSMVQIMAMYSKNWRFSSFNCKKPMGEAHQRNEPLMMEFETLWRLFTRRSFGEGKAFWTTPQARRKLRPCLPCPPIAVVERRRGGLLHFPFLSPQQGCFSSSGKATEWAVVLRKGPHSWDPHAAQPALLPPNTCSHPANHKTTAKWLRALALTRGTEVECHGGRWQERGWYCPFPWDYCSRLFQKAASPIL